MRFNNVMSLLNGKFPDGYLNDVSTALSKLVKRGKKVPDPLSGEGVRALLGQEALVLKGEYMTNQAAMHYQQVAAENKSAQGAAKRNHALLTSAVQNAKHGPHAKPAQLLNPAEIHPSIPAEASTAAPATNASD